MARRFTLVEILVVTGIICLLAAFIIVGYNGAYRSWSNRNTVATMKSAQLVLDRYRLEYGSFPVANSAMELSIATNASDSSFQTLARWLKEACDPRVVDHNNEITVIDDFGYGNALRYAFPYQNTGTFVLASAGKDGIWGGDNAENECDDIIFLPNGFKSLNMKPGFYMVRINKNDLSFSADLDEIEPLAE